MATISEVTAPDPQVDALLARHLDLMRSQSPEESCHVMSADALRASGARVFVLRDDDAASAVGALKSMPGGGVELKSMHVAQEHRGKGYGKMMLSHLLHVAEEIGHPDVWLETGSADDFAPARGMYEAAGFAYCPPFGGYVEDPLSVFMSRVVQTTG